MDLKQGDLENIILNALWDLEKEGVEKIFVGDIQSRIKSSKKKWAYTTVKTVLDRLVDKDIAVRHKDGKKYLYQSVVNRGEAGVLAIQKVMRQYFKNDVSQLLDCLDGINGVNGASAVSGQASPIASQNGSKLSERDQERSIVAQRLEETRQKLSAISEKSISDKSVAEKAHAR